MPSSRLLRPLLVLGLAAAVVALTVTLLGGGPATTTGAAASPSAATPAPHAVSPAPATTTNSPDGQRAYPPIDPGYPVPPGAGALDGPITDQALQTLLDQGSDLDPALRLSVCTLGAEVINADLTTTGAAALARTWPRLWPAGPPDRPVVTGLRVHAITARTDRSTGGYQVIAVYSGTNAITTETIDHASITIQIQRTPSGLQPVAPS
ncbi:hypothetical protein [Kutzneria buriramensis]|uniref:Uncharacterized protein n=1 Tax=Kutzneria buriramensis TaxID=1045776 RepID=A0A3E0GXM3_9PSEU|nr:hypothetical protein [Kutzneria buriramensis]REH31023.1 hypothetical protein BCF44_12246 [Kutzneria buriramensis]